MNVAVWYKFLMRESIESNDKIDEFLMIHQNFPYKVFLLTIVYAVLATVLSIFYSLNISQCQFVNIFPYQKFVSYSSTLMCKFNC